MGRVGARRLSDVRHTGRFLRGSGRWSDQIRMLFLDGVYVIDGEPPVFCRLPAPRPQALEQLIHTISQRVGAYLEREGLLVRDIENSYLQLEAPEDSAMNDLRSHSITYRIAVGPQAGRKAVTLQTIPAREEDSDNSTLAKTAGFS